MNKTSLFSWTAVLAGVFLFIYSSPAAAPDAAPAPTHAPIPWDQIGAKAGADYRGDGLRVTAQGESVKLNCMFQRLEGEATPEGLWLTSTVTNQVQDRFRVVATALGRTTSNPLSRPDGHPLPTAWGEVLWASASGQRTHPLPTAWGEGRGEGATTSCCAASRPLARTGKVTVADQTVRYERPGLVEEYTVSMDGVRQDFVVLEKPLSRPDGHPLPTAWGEGRGEEATTSCGAMSRPLARTGTVTVADQTVRYERPGLVEEYTVSMDGIRQDFVVLEKPLSRPDGHPLPTPWGEGRGEGVTTSCCTASRPLGRTGKVTVADQTVRYERPGLVEEYTVSMDGVRQDFVVLEKPLSRPAGRLLPTAWGEVVWASASGQRTHPLPTAWGEGRGEGSDELRLELAVSGARVERTAVGAQLVLAESGRKIAYSRLRVTDAAGKELPARMEVTEVAEDSAFRTPHSALSLAIVVDDTAAAYPIRIDPTFSDANWISMGGVPGTDSTVRAAVVDGAGHLYIGGDFTVAGDAAANYVAKWDGSSWHGLGTGMGGEMGEDGPCVYALAASGSDLYAGGDFKTAGGVTANCIAKWDGSSWHALGAGIGGEMEEDHPFVFALAVSGSDLYVGGYFTTAGSVTANYIARWDGSSWHALGAGVDYTVSALAVSGSDLYAGGGFTTAGGVTANHIAKWDGSSWHALGRGMDSGVDALAVSGNGDLYAGGWFDTAGDVTAKRIAKWDGNQWHALGGGMDNGVDALAVSGNNLYAGGGFRTAGGVTANSIAKWDGNQWHALGAGMGDRFHFVLALAVSGSDLYVGGGFRTAGGVTANSIAQWDGSSWHALGVGMDNGVYALAVSGNGDLYAGGSFDTAGGVTVNNIARWDGSSWHALGAGVDNTVGALAVSGSDLYVGGYFTTAGGVAASYIAQWDGNQWHALGGGVNGYVLALAVSGSDLYVGGYFITAGGVTAYHIAKWDGSSWHALGGGMDGLVWALAVSGNNLYAGGGFRTAGGVTAYHIAKWDGSSWHALGGGMDGLVWALAVSGNNLYAGGGFRTAGGVTAYHIAKWDGSSWHALGGGMDGLVWALAVSGNNLYAGGGFRTAGGVTAYHIAKWDGSSWHALGGGMDSPVYALAVSGNGDLYAGGRFDTAGDVTANSIAKWDGSSWHALGAGVDFTVGALAVLGSDLYVGGDFKTAGGKVSPYLARAVLDLQPPLTPIPLQWQLQNQQLVLSWTNADFQLQAAPEATGTYTNVPNATSPYTNPLTGPRRFFRLHAP